MLTQPYVTSHRAGIFSLVALTLHYTVLSIVLHIARSAPGPKFHASSAVWLTELFKMVVAASLVLWTGELRPRAMELRVRGERDRERAEGTREEHAPLWLEQSEGGGGGAGDLEMDERGNSAVEEKKMERQASVSSATGVGDRKDDHTTVPSASLAASSAPSSHTLTVWYDPQSRSAGSGRKAP